MTYLSIFREALIREMQSSYHSTKGSFSTTSWSLPWSRRFLTQIGPDFVRFSSRIWSLTSRTLLVPISFYRINAKEWKILWPNWTKFCSSSENLWKTHGKLMNSPHLWYFETLKPRRNQRYPSAWLILNLWVTANMFLWITNHLQTFITSIVNQLEEINGHVG